MRNTGISYFRATPTSADLMEAQRSPRREFGLDKLSSQPAAILTIPIESKRTNSAFAFTIAQNKDPYCSSTMSGADEISITLTNLSGVAESIVVSSTSTTLEELASLSTALGIADESSSSSGNSAITFTVDGKVVYDAGSSAGGGSGGQRKLGEAGIKNGDMVLVGTSAGRRGQAASAPAPAAASAASGASGGGGLDFSALLASAGTAPAPAAAPAAAASSASTSGGGSAGLSFNIAGLEAMSASMGGMGAARAAPVEWPGMSLDDAMAQNPNPAQFVPLLLR